MRGAAALLLALAACEGAPAPAPAPAPSARAPEAPARRPTRRYFVGRTASRCEVYHVGEAGLGKAVEVPCPQDLEIGERIRLAGKTCLRESSVHDRVEPVVCPGALMDREEADHDAGVGG